MPRMTEAELERIKRDERRIGYVKACLETGPRPVDAKQEAHFLAYYSAKATIVYPD